MNAISEILQNSLMVSCGPPFELDSKNWNCHTHFLWVERHCFDQRNGFQQFLERLKQFKSISEILQNSLVISCGPPFALEKKMKLSYPVFMSRKTLFWSKKCFSTIFRTFEAVECNFWNFAKLVGGILWSPLCPWQKKLNFLYKFLRVEKHCFDQRKGFQQFLEGLKQSLRQFLKCCNIRWWYPVVPLLHLPKKNWNCHTQFYERKDIVLIKEMVFNNF